MKILHDAEQPLKNYYEMLDSHNQFFVDLMLVHKYLFRLALKTVDLNTSAIFYSKWYFSLMVTFFKKVNRLDLFSTKRAREGAAKSKLLLPF